MRIIQEKYVYTYNVKIIYYILYCNYFKGDFHMDPIKMKKAGSFYNMAKSNLVKILKEKLFLFSKKNIDIKNIETYCITEEDNTLIEDIRSARNEWLNADSNLQHVCESEIIDYYTYMLKAAQIKYEYFLKKAKERGVRLRQGVHGADVKNAQIGK